MRTAILCAFVALAQGADEGTLRVETVAAAPGALVDVRVRGSSDFLVTCYSFAVGHEKGRVILREVKLGDDVLAAGVESTTPKVNEDAAEPYGALFVVADMFPLGDTPPLDLSGEKVLAVFTYEVTPDAAEGLSPLFLRSWYYGEDPKIHCMFCDTLFQDHFPDLVSGGIDISLEAPPELPFVRADTNADGGTDIADVVWLLSYLFADGAPPACIKTADANDMGDVDIADAIYILGYLFANGSDPGQPFDACGLDSTPDELSCLSYSPCAPPPGEPGMFGER
jgi:hypothetical protein